MKIVDVKAIRASRFCFVHIYTDNGIVGLGEGGAFGAADAMAAHINFLSEYLIGKDPLQIERHWQVMTRNVFFIGSAIMGAISAIDMALWDIAGRYYKKPIYQLLGGSVRDKVRVYPHVYARTDEDMKEACLKRVAEGYTAIGHLSPFLDLSKKEKYNKSQNNKIKEAVERLYNIRKLVGDDIDLCIEIQRSLSIGEASLMLDQLVDLNPLFIEDPIIPGNSAEMANVAKKTRIPIATGERIYSMYEFNELIQKNGAQYLRVDLALCGGFTGAKKIAALAEANMKMLVPHCTLTPVSTAATLQFCANVDNVCIMEYTDPYKVVPGTDYQKTAIVKTFHKPINGYLELPQGDGLDIELVDHVEDYKPISISPNMCLNYDGSLKNL